MKIHHDKAEKVIIIWNNKINPNLESGGFFAIKPFDARMYCKVPK